LGGARAAAGRLLGTTPALRDYTLAGRLFGQPLAEEFLGFEQISDPTMSLEARAALGQGREGITRRDIQRQLEESTQGFEAELGGGAEAVGVGPTLEETKKGAAERLQMRIQSRDPHRETQHRRGH